ncbi:MAG TPA: glycosyltransferase [Vicinamibacterales bacterium]|jgi:glycosyltransferase involved in cell wall biosynthesis|nr:glycosyltransferase [Vicinamibacterales bacterium]
MTPRVALVHDWLTGMRGGERVLEGLCRLYPDAELFTLVHVRGAVSPAIEGRRVHTSLVQRLPRSARYYRHYLPLFPLAIEQFDLDRFDLVISSSHCAAKSVVTTGRARHVCYCHSPMRYAWDQFDAYFGEARVGRAASMVMRQVMRRMARWDAATARRVDRFVANSRHVAGRIGRYYNRQATVVYPPVDTAFFHPDGTVAGDYFLVVSALVPYKRIELAIAAAARAGVRLKIAGVGTERPRLERLAGPSVEFLGRVSNDAVRDLYRGAQAVLMPGEEDFGIVPVEAQACGRPTIALAAGGALETIEDGVTGVLVPEPNVDMFAAAITRVSRDGFDPQVLRAHAERFSEERFLSDMSQVITDVLAAPAEARW